MIGNAELRNPGMYFLKLDPELLRLKLTEEYDADDERSQCGQECDGADRAHGRVRQRKDDKQPQQWTEQQKRQRHVKKPLTLGSTELMMHDD